MHHLNAASLATPKVLIIDDDEYWQNYLRTPLLSHTDSNSILIRGNRNDSQDLLAKERFDLVILNIRLEYGPVDSSKTEWFVNNWTALLDYVKHTSKDAETLIVTSESQPPALHLEEISRIAFKYYKTEKIFVKERFDPNEYREILANLLAETSEAAEQPRVTDAVQPTGKGEDMIDKITKKDRDKLIEELLDNPAWEEGPRGMTSVLLQVGLTKKWIASLGITNPQIDTPIVVEKLEKLGWMKDRPTHTGLGSLVEYLLNHTQSLEGSLFLPLLLRRYNLIRKWGNEDPTAVYPDVSTADDAGPGTTFENMPGVPVFTPEEFSDWTRLEARWSERSRFVETVFLEQGAIKARSVCRIEASGGDARGTGVLIGENLVLTCHHVIPDDDTENYLLRFGFRVDEKGRLEAGVPSRIVRVVKRSTVDELDYALLEIEPQGPLDADPISPKSVALETLAPVYIVQHPLGMPQKIVLQDNWITYVAKSMRRCQYLAMTAKASSGSPVFNESWELVALHHSGGPVPRPTGGQDVAGNEGIPMHAILPEIEEFL